MHVSRNGAAAAVLLGLAILVGCKSKPEVEEKSSDQRKLEGPWKVTKVEGGKAGATDGVGLKEGDVVVVEERILSTTSGEPLRLRITLDGDKDPKEITFVEVDEKGKPVQEKKGAEPMTEYRHRGVYKLDGDTLTVTLAPVNTSPRPKEVGSTEKGNVTLTLTKTAKPKPGANQEKKPEEPKKDKDKKDKDKKTEEPKKEEKKSVPSDFGEK
jgi:uncharacterized protein (TIGR03067 family)